MIDDKKKMALAILTLAFTAAWMGLCLWVLIGAGRWLWSKA